MDSIKILKSDVLNFTSLLFQDSPEVQEEIEKIKQKEQANEQSTQTDNREPDPVH